jgi:hypothetical protein
MALKDEIKSCMLVAMKDRLDPYMSAQEFNRRKASLIYKRVMRGSTQKIDLAVQIHPKDNLNAAAAVYPSMEILVPHVDAILDKMVCKNLGLLEGITGGTSKQPIEFTSQKAQLGRWFLYQPDSVSGVVDDIRAFLENWTMPFLDNYTTPEDIVIADERNDGRIVRDRAQLMRVVAAALFLKRRDYAQEIMETRLGAPGIRRRYQQIYDFIQRM